jgi:hypothetical protein
MGRFGTAAGRGKKRAIIAVAHSIVVSAFHRLIRDEPYRELGANYFDNCRQGPNLAKGDFSAK